MPAPAGPTRTSIGEEETFVLLDGRMTFTVAGRTYDAAAGTVLLTAGALNAVAIDCDSRW